MTRANELLSQAQALRKNSGDGKQHLELFKKALTLYQSALHPLNAELMAHIDEAMSASIGMLLDIWLHYLTTILDAQEYSQAYEYCKKSLAIYESIFKWYIIISLN